MRNAERSERLRQYIAMQLGEAGLEGLYAESPVETFAARPMRPLTEGAGSPGEIDPRATLESVARGEVIDDALLAEAEAIVVPVFNAPVDVINDGFTFPSGRWEHLSADAALRANILAAIPAVGRIEVSGATDLPPYGGTGFVIGDGLVMTNRHVAAIFASGVGIRQVRFRNGIAAGVDFRRERNEPAGTVLSVREVVMIHPYWDMALLRVEGLTEKQHQLKLSQVEPDDIKRRQVVVIGYPGWDGHRNDQHVMDADFRGQYDYKRLQPGHLQGRINVVSYNKTVRAAAHDCSTLGGNSGSAVIDVETGEVVALHFGGRYLRANFGVPGAELARDGRVIDAGARFVDTPRADAALPWRSHWDATEQEVPATTATTAAAGGSPPGGGAQAKVDQPPPAGGPGVVLQADGTVNLTIPLVISVRLGGLAAPAVVAAPAAEAMQVERAADEMERLVEPWRAPLTIPRKGYDPMFTGTSVPMPTAKDASVLAPLLAGGSRLDYEHFSILMHAQRRLALVTAANVTYADSRRLPPGTPSDAFTRKKLTGLGKNDREKWFPDPRISPAHQLPDAFFEYDGGDFDKGHLVRRNDVTFGSSYDQIRRANGDTFHATNCSPQVASFNRPAFADPDGSTSRDDWGDLEAHVQSEAARDAFAVFAGPVLAPADPIVIGSSGERRRIRVQIPKAYWKVIVAPLDSGLGAFGFVLEQDLSGTDAETIEGFAVPELFRRKMMRLAGIEAMTGVDFSDIVRQADQYDTVGGIEVARRARARRT